MCGAGRYDIRCADRLCYAGAAGLWWCYCGKTGREVGLTKVAQKSAGFAIKVAQKSAEIMKKVAQKSAKII